MPLRRNLRQARFTVANSMTAFHQEFSSGGSCQKSCNDGVAKAIQTDRAWNEDMSEQKFIETTHGRIAISDIAGEGTPLLMLHCNSGCKEMFLFQNQALAGTRRLVSLDLPGHGASSDAIAPQHTYCFGGYAEAIAEVLAKLGIDRVAILGHSLGGHIALDLVARLANVSGVMIFGTPPIPPGPEGAQLGFLPNPEMAYTGNPTLTDEQVEGVVAMALGPGAERDLFYTSAVRRADGRARQHMVEAVLAGSQIDQRELITTSHVPLAVINGADDPVINLDYIDRLRYRNLWTNRPLRLAGAGHGAHWQQHKLFNEILRSFLVSLD
ncbi:alpha/beta fold hydrolase [Agrobacterium tumefaciens]|uniref:alpha/beta fold hydrolase n=1 Tax=Agrobacterium tumefaciens TaxID=358 RepID=UPI001E3CEFAB|nr:alpha/beta hydrolase [Agrobacterium tumefaciens]